MRRVFDGVERTVTVAFSRRLRAHAGEWADVARTAGSLGPRWQRSGRGAVAATRATRSSCRPGPFSSAGGGAPDDHGRGRVSPDAPGFLDQSVIKCQIRCHPRTPNSPTHSHVWGTSGHGSPGSPCLTRGSGGAASAGAARDLQPTMLANTARVPEPAGAHRVRRDRSVPRPGRGQELPRRSRIARCFCCPRGATRAAGWPAVIRPSLHRAALGPEPSRWHLENAVRAGTWCTYRPRPRWAGAAPDRSRQAGGVGPGGCPPDALLPALMLRNDQDSRRPRVSTPWRGAGHSRCSRDRPARSSPARSSCCR
jgi:hypothetical protein